MDFTDLRILKTQERLQNGPLDIAVNIGCISLGFRRGRIGKTDPARRSGGCPSRGKSDLRPNDWRFGEGTDQEAQRRWYERFLEALERNPWIRGTGWWDWSATRLYPEETGMDQNGYCTYGKPANGLLKRFSEKIQP